MSKRTSQRKKEIFDIFPIAYVHRKNNKTYIDILDTYVPALKELEQFSHLQMFWWLSEFQGDEYRSFTHVKPPYDKDAPDTGVFACRSPVRPNPIGLTTTKILNIDHKNGILEITGIDAYDHTPIIDLKAYFPGADRVKEVNVPEWIAHWPEWLPAEGNRLEKGEEEMKAQKRSSDSDVFQIFPVGHVSKKDGNTFFKIYDAFLSGLKQIEHFSHLQLLWWCHRFDKKRYRRTIQCNPPYEHAPKTGVFASRSPVRPNPIGLTTVKILEVDAEAGMITVKGLDAFEHTPIIDLKPYIPCCDRVKDVDVPEWIRHWPQWLQTEDEIEIVSPDNLRPGDSDRLAVFMSPSLREKPGVQSHDFALLEKSVLNKDKGEENNIIIRGARTHNLRNIDVIIPRKKLTVITGISGSGKSSLAFDTLYAEGQRRYMEGLSSQARQLLDQMEKPDVDQILGLNPTIAIEQKTISRNPRSTVGTITQIYDFLRVLFSRLGTRYCPQCGRAVKPQTARQITARLAALMPGTQFQIQTKTFILPDEADQDNQGAEQKGFYKTLFETVKSGLESGNGTITVTLREGEEFLLSTHDACPYCNRIFFGLTAALFSYNNPDGICPDCNGLGVRLNVDPALVVTNPELSLLDRASPWYGELRKVKPSGNWMRSELFALADHLQVDLDLPWKNLPQNFRDAALYGTGDEIISWTYDMKKRGRSISFDRPVQGAVNNIKRLLQQTDSETTRKSLLQFTREQPCSTCQGERLCPEARFVTLGGRRYPEVAAMTIAQIHEWVADLPRKMNVEQRAVAGDTLIELHQRLQSLLHVGLHYLTLDRSAPTLSGGEGQRIRLATQLGGGLTGLLYILDEPSIGLHPRDHHSLLEIIRQLRDVGNTVVVVEHEADAMRSADWLIDLGPGAGVLGGKLIAAGIPEDVMTNPESLSGQYLSGALQVASPNGKKYRTPQAWLTIAGARLHNLKNIDVRFPLGILTCVTGVSGSGKSSLVAQTLAPALATALNRAEAVPGPHDRFKGLEHLNKLITISQAPIGRTPRSNPGTYVGVFDEIRKVFANTVDAKERKYNANRFSFNTKGGCCEACQGDGRKRIEMHFLPDVWVTCTECQGRRFNRETLEITYHGKSIADVLDMDVQEALDFFAKHTKIRQVLQTLRDVGLEYIKLGQSALTLSGGEAQRVKLAKELWRPDTGRTLYILDEPTTGLHFADIQKLLDVLHRLTEAGNTVIIIEHNLDVIKTADWIIDLGPEGGDNGGYVVAQGTPEDVAKTADSYTGQFLKQVLNKYTYPLL